MDDVVVFHVMEKLELLRLILLKRLNFPNNKILIKVYRERYASKQRAFP